MCLKTLSTAALLSLACADVQAASTPTDASAQVGYSLIDAKGLEKLIQSKAPIALVDARSDKYFDGNLIQGAQRLPAEASDETIAQILPDANQQVVVYCAGVGCPASEMLAKRLVASGYTQVYDYHGGIKEWMSLNKPIQTVK